MASRRALALVALWLTVTCAVATACTDDGDGPGPTQPSGSKQNPAARPAKLTFGVWGAAEEIAAYQGVVDIYSEETREARVKIEPFGSHDELRAALDDGQVPDVFLVSRGDLTALTANKINQPLSDLLDEREVDFGDGYSRVALEAFSADRDVQCMPYGISPMVIYYNRDLVDFAAMAARDLPVPDIDDEDLTKKPQWNLEMFTAAAEYASRPRRGIAGFQVPASLRGLAPFIYSGGGQLFDDDDAPTSLAFSSEDTRSALEKVLPLLRDPKVGLTTEQLAEKPVEQWFEDGQLGMIAGFRSMVPELRASGIDFDVMPMPVVDDAATIGDLTGICISSGTDNLPEAADFLVDFISAESVGVVAEAGYLSPANVPVALSDFFLQPGREPLHSIVYAASIKNMRIPPLLGSYSSLDAAVATPISLMLTVPLLDPDTLTALTDEIDLDSQAVLAPESASESPTDEPSG